MEHKNPTIDIIKGLAIFLVVCGHVIQRTMVVQSEDFFLNPAFQVIYTFHMPLFVFVSGYLMAWTLKRKSLSGALESRARSLFLPCMVWGILDALVLSGLDKIDGKSFGIANHFIDQLLVYPAVWFLWTLFACSCLLLLSLELQKKMGAIAFMIVVLALWFVPFPANQYFALYYIQWFYPFYLVGYFLNRDGWTVDKLKPSIPLIVSVTLFAAFLSFWNKDDYIYVHHMHVPADYTAHMARMTYRYFMGFSGIAAAVWIGYFLSKTKLARSLAFLGVFSLDIYLIQRYLVEGLYPRIIERFSFNWDFNSPVVIFLFTPAAALFFIGICLCISKMILRKNYLLNRLLLGGRI